MLSVAEVLGHRAGQPDSHGAGVKGVILWAPVSKPFPYNILYYTDEAEDRGKWLRGEIAKFEARLSSENVPKVPRKNKAG